MNMLALIDEESNFPKVSDFLAPKKLCYRKADDNLVVWLIFRAQTPPCSKRWISFMRKEMSTFAQRTSMKQFLESGILQERFTTTHKVLFFGFVASKTFTKFPLCSHKFCFVSGFLEKNRDAFSSDMIQVVEASTNKLLRQTFQNELSSSSKTIKSSSNPRMVITMSKSSTNVSNVSLNSQITWTVDAVSQRIVLSNRKLLRRSGCQLWLVNSVSLWTPWWKRCQPVSHISFAASNPMTLRGPWWAEKL